jgi:hypothetical protein
MSVPRANQAGEHGSLDAPPGSQPWAVAARREAQGTLHSLAFSSEQLRGWIDILRENGAHRQLTDRAGLLATLREALADHDPESAEERRAIRAESDVRLLDKAQSKIVQ